MCGIAGIIQQQPGAYSIDHVKKMTRALAHRGPDGEVIWQNDSQHAIVGHRRLAIIDLSAAAAQPFHYLNRYTIVYNGELYNYIELKEILVKKGYAFSTQSDTEVLVAAYDCWQENCLQQFDGMFAFSIWDDDEKKLFAARDRFGEKPFFYFFDDEKNVFWFASELKALWQAGIVKTPNLQLLFNFLTIGYTDNPDAPGETFDEHIEKLPAAHYLQLSLKNFSPQVTRYWDIDVEREIKTKKDAYVTEQFKELFQRSVQRRLRSDVQTGTSLSGGLDSSSIATVIHQLPEGKNKYHTFSAIFPGFEKDEAAHIDQVANQFSFTSFKNNIDDKDVPALLQRVMQAQDEPISSASSLAQFAVYEMAKQQGVKVLLDGQGADEILAGYNKYYKWYWQELFRKKKFYGHTEYKAAQRLGIQEKFGLKNMIAALFPSLASVVLEKQYLLNALSDKHLTPEFIKRYSNEAYYSTPEIFTLNGVLYFNTCIHGLEELLRYADRNSMAHGTEVRLPFLNHELVEFLFTLPSHYKIREGKTKWLLRNAMREELPSSIVNRTDKTGFEPPQKKWMELPAVQEMIMQAKKKLVDMEILHPSTLQDAVIATAAYDKDNYDWRYLAASVLF